MTQASQTRKVYPLLIYRALSRRWRWPSLLIIPLGLILWWIHRHSGPYAILILLAPFAGSMLLAYSLLLGNAAVVCHSKHFTVRGPLFPLALSYRRIENVRPENFSAIFPPLEEKQARVRLYRELWSKTAVVIDLRGYPLAERWLRLWFDRYFFYPKGTALVILVEDWMGLVRQLEIHRTEARTRRRA